MINSVILFEGRLETLDFFSLQLGKAFAQEGLEVYLVDLKGGEESYEKLNHFLEAKAQCREEVVALGFSFGGLSKERAVYAPKEGYLWGKYETPVYNMVCDHPYHFFKRLRALEAEEKAGRFHLNCYHQISIDRDHRTFMQDYFPNFEAELFLPLAGTYYEGEDKGNGYRDIEILFAGNYTDQSFVDTYLSSVSPEEKAFLEEAMKMLREDDSKRVDEVVALLMQRENPGHSKEDYLNRLGKSVFLDFYVRNYYRGKIVKAIGDFGLPLTIVGSGWDKLWAKDGEEIPGQIKLLQEATSKQVLSLMQRSKVCLNVMPWFKDGAHDRIYNAILNGSIAFSDKSNYLGETLAEKQGIIYYDRRDLSSMGRKLARLLADLSDRDYKEKLLEDGRSKIEENDTWEARAKTILQTLSRG